MVRPGLWFPLSPYVQVQGGVDDQLWGHPVPSSLLHIAVCSSWQHVWTKTYATKIKLKNSFISRVLWLFSKFKALLKFQLCIFTLYFVPGREKFISKFCLEKILGFLCCFDLFWHLAGMLAGSSEYQWLSGLQDGDAVYRPPLAHRLHDPAFPDQLQSQSHWSLKSKCALHERVIICPLIPNVSVSGYIKERIWGFLRTMV